VRTGAQVSMPQPTLGKDGRFLFSAVGYSVILKIAILREFSEFK